MATSIDHNSGDSRLLTFELIRDEQHRLYSLAEIRQMLAEGVVTEATIARGNGQQVWRPLADVLKTMGTSTPTAPPAMNPGRKYPFPVYFLSLGRIGRGTWLFRNLMHLLLLGVITVPFMESTAVGVTVLRVTVGSLFIYVSLVTHVKRLHDLNQSAWMLFVIVIPPLGLLLLFLDGTEGINRYGTRPKPFQTGLPLVGANT